MLRIFRVYIRKKGGRNHGRKLFEESQWASLVVSTRPQDGALMVVFAPHLISRPLKFALDYRQIIIYWIRYVPFLILRGYIPELHIRFPLVQSSAPFFTLVGFWIRFRNPTRRLAGTNFYPSFAILTLIYSEVSVSEENGSQIVVLDFVPRIVSRGLQNCDSNSCTSQRYLVSLINLNPPLPQLDAFK